MPKALPEVPPVEKLPLAARKDIRDNWEANLEDLTQLVAKYLKETYTFEVDFKQLYAHAEASDASWVKSSPGSAAKAYFESFTDYLKRFTEEGEYTEAVDSFNELISSRKVRLAHDNSFTYAGCSVKGDVFEINYQQQNPGTNTSYACQDIAKEFDKGLRAKEPTRLPLSARRSIRDSWESEKKEEVEAKIKEELPGAPEMKLVVDYNDIWSNLVEGAKKDKDLDLQRLAESFGSYIESYFSGFVYQINYRFKKDDMMVEGFAEAVDKNEIVLEVVQETKTPLKSTYYEVEIKDGRFIMRTIPKYWGTNTSYVCEKIVDLL